MVNHFLPSFPNSSLWVICKDSLAKQTHRDAAVCCRHLSLVCSHEQNGGSPTTMSGGLICMCGCWEREMIVCENTANVNAHNSECVSCVHLFHEIWLNTELTWGAYGSLHMAGGGWKGDRGLACVISLLKGQGRQKNPWQALLGHLIFHISDKRLDHENTERGLNFLIDQISVGEEMCRRAISYKAHKETVDGSWFGFRSFWLAQNYSIL